jgi:hypothetical protein
MDSVFTLLSVLPFVGDVGNAVKAGVNAGREAVEAG